MMSDPTSSLQSQTQSNARSPHEALWLLHLFFAPRRFFTYFPTFVTWYSTAYASLIVGISDANSRVTERVAKQDLGGGGRLPSALVESWILYWILCVGAGIIGAVLFYQVGGWWYRVRLQWAGDETPDPRLAKRVYIFASLITALPVVLLTIIDTFRYSTPLAAERGFQWWWMGTLIFPFWSVYASYRGVRTLFQTIRGKARLWFLVLPSAFYSLLFAGVAALGVLATLGILSVPPDLDHPKAIDRTGFSMRYPGNWWVDEDEEGFDPDHSFTIEPVQEALITFTLFDESGDAAALTAETLEGIRETFVGGEVSRFDHWGPHSGDGASYVGTTQGSRYNILIFSMTTDRRSVTIVELVSQEATKLVEPGLALVRNSFRLKE